MVGMDTYDEFNEKIIKLHDGRLELATVLSK
jgi:hypothetical protein